MTVPLAAVQISSDEDDYCRKFFGTKINVKCAPVLTSLLFNGKNQQAPVTSAPLSTFRESFTLNELINPWTVGLGNLFSNSC